MVTKKQLKEWNRELCKAYDLEAAYKNLVVMLDVAAALKNLPSRWRRTLLRKSRRALHDYWQAEKAADLLEKNSPQ